MNGPNQYEYTTEGGYKVIHINNVKGHGSWTVTSEIKDSEVQYIHPEAGKTLNMTIENEKLGVVVVKKALAAWVSESSEGFNDNYFDTQKYDEAAGVELEENAQE